MAPASRGCSGLAALWPSPRLPLLDARVVLLVAAALPLGCCKLSRIERVPEVAAEQVKEEVILEVEYYRVRKKYGVEDRRTLDAFFEVYDLWIMMYRLNKIDAAMAEIWPACQWRLDTYTVKAIQARAFTKWKHGHLREALALFHLMEGYMGKNYALSENIGHTYNNVGMYDEAEKYFTDALTLTKLNLLIDPNSSDSNEGGILLGLSNVQDRRGDHEKSLKTAIEAYDYYKAKDSARGWDTSLTAKAAMQVGKQWMFFGNASGAESYTREALRNFEHTSGMDSPLLVGPLQRLGGIYLKAERWEEARWAYHRAYIVAAVKDQLDLVEVLEAHNALVDCYFKDKSRPLDRVAFKKYFEVAEAVTDRVKREMKQDGNAGAYYKAAGEIFVLGENCLAGKPLLKEAIRLFRGETSIDTSGLIRQCSDLVKYCDGETNTNTLKKGKYVDKLSATGGRGIEL